MNDTQVYSEEKYGRGYYITKMLKMYATSGDSYMNVLDAYLSCRMLRKGLTETEFKKDLIEQIKRGFLAREGGRLYLQTTLNYENKAAEFLADILKHNELSGPKILTELVLENGIPLSEEQQNAVRQALSYRLSIILGGAGTGKSSLIRAMVNNIPKEQTVLLCAPTGKAACNLMDRTGLEARTIHSILGKGPDADMLSKVVWRRVGLVVVDESSMIDLGMFAGLLGTITSDCHLVLLGDPNQLLSVGSGNVLHDLLKLGIPNICLQENHRQKGKASALFENVVHFSKKHSLADMVFDESFQFCELGKQEASRILVQQAVKRYCAGEDIMVLTPYNQKDGFGVEELNPLIREKVNPITSERKIAKMKLFEFRDQDRIMITKNDRRQNIANGDIGTLHIERFDADDHQFGVQLSGGRSARWDYAVPLFHMTLAYAITIHKSQGSEADTVLIPIFNDFQNMLTRNLIYTAISRAKKKVILYGDRSALDIALQKLPNERKSMLINKTHMVMHKCA